MRQEPAPDLSSGAVFLILRFRAKWIAKIVIFGPFDLTNGKGPFFNGVIEIQKENVFF